MSWNLKQNWETEIWTLNKNHDLSTFLELFLSIDTLSNDLIVTKESILLNKNDYSNNQILTMIYSLNQIILIFFMTRQALFLIFNILHFSNVSLFLIHSKKSKNFSNMNRL